MVHCPGLFSIGLEDGERIYYCLLNQFRARLVEVKGWIKARLHGSPRLINAVESTKVNRVNTSFQRN